MKLILPVSSRDISLAKSLSVLLKEQGQLKAHTAHIVHPYALDTQLQDVRENLEAVFAEVKITELPVPDMQDPTPHPMAHVAYANQMFAATITLLAEENNQEPWIWFEPDCCPLQAGFLDALLQEYRNAFGAGKKFLGSILTPADFVREGEVIKLVEKPGEKYLVGTAIYPPNMHEVSRTWKVTPNVIPFDRYNQYEVVPKAKHTDSIYQNHGTQKYRVAKDGKSLQCATVHTPTRSKTNLQIPTGTLVFHGCKDNSLIELVRKGELPTTDD